MLARSAGHPIYWAGPRPRVTYELTLAGDGSVFVRYLPRGVRVGDPRTRFLTVATYPRAGGVDALRGAPGRTIELGGGAVGLVRPERPTSVYLAFPGSDVQVEVYDPSPIRARRLVLSGSVRPIR